MRNVLNKTFLLLFLVVIQLFGQELWQSYKAESLNGNDSVIHESEISNIYLLINQDTLTGYEKQSSFFCYDISSWKVDSTKNDSIFSSSFFLREQIFAAKITQSLYYFDDKLIWYEVNTFDTGDTSIVKGYFKKIDLSFEKQLNANLCTTSITKKDNQKSKKQSYDQLFYSLLGQKVNTHSIRRSQIMNVMKCNKVISVNR